MSDKKRIMIIDGNNNFYRAWIVDPSLSSTNGQPIGGLKGFLKILQKLCRVINPDKIIICWDGVGGSQRRKSMVKEYKDGRKPIHFNNNIVPNMSEEDKFNNQIWQLTRLADYINDLPIIQTMLDGVEADDVIAYSVNHEGFKDYNKVIVSNDKDFYQLVANDVIIYRPVNETFMGVKSVLQEFAIHPVNFALARAIAGDKSDNLQGVEGVGLKTLAKRVPILTENKFYTVEDVTKYCKEKDNGKIKAYNSIITNTNLIARNYSVMQLSSPQISYDNVRKIKYVYENSECVFNKEEVKKKMIADGFGEFNTETLFNQMNKIVLENCTDLG